MLTENQELEVKETNIKLFNNFLFTFSKHKNGGWFRLFGYGLSWKPISEGLLFSQRNGYRRYFRFGGYYFTFLNK